MELEALERRIRRLEDLEEIKQLKARYAAHCDANYDADALAELFTADAVWDGGMLGRSEGRLFANSSAVRASAFRLPSTMCSTSSSTSRVTQRLVPGTSCRPVPIPTAIRRCWGQQRTMTSMYGKTACGNFAMCVLSRISGHLLRRAGHASSSSSGANGMGPPQTGPPVAAQGGAATPWSSCEGGTGGRQGSVNLMVSRAACVIAAHLVP